jgi:hypothetical protein
MSDARARVEKICARLDSWTANNPRFFDGTLLAEAVAKEHCT